MTNKSYVLGRGRITLGQKRAICEHWNAYGIDIATNSPLTSERLFGDTRELVLEIGFGNGDSLLQMAQNFAHLGFIGIEVHNAGIGHLLLNIVQKQCDNIRIIRADAAQVLQNNIADGTLKRVQIYFPDPWRKKRHHKRRLIQTSLIDLLWRKLQNGGSISLATDWENYAQWMLACIRASSFNWRNLGDSSGYAARDAWRETTKFEQRGIAKGHLIWDLHYEKNADN